ncbi:extracellular solute-binding protein [Fluviibacterium sp. DFM31]|uniref:Extracellular solute-binding protein n=1 Tax=Meridianimarinicoccus marinus TaxID=3231483 RepID=A0ABV3LCW1_9RHOB
MKHLVQKIAGATVAVALSLSAASADEVEFMNWLGAEETGKDKLADMAAGFEATGNTVDIQAYAWGDLPKNLFLRARSNTLPDVSQIQGRMLPTFSGIDALVDLNEVIGKDKLEEMFPASFLAMGDIDGKQLALPWIGGTIGWVANTEVLEAAGVTEIPTTVEEFTAALIAVRDNVPNSVPYALATKNNNSILLDYLIWSWTFGSDVIVDGKPVVNSPEGKAALAYLTMLVAERLAAPEIDRPDSRRLFAQGATAFYLDAPVARAFARTFSGRDEEIDAAVKPIMGPVLAEGDTPQSIQWGHVIALFGDDNATSDSAALAFVMHLLSDEVLVDYAADQGVLPTTKAGLASERITGDQYLKDWAEASVAPRRNTIASLDNGGEVAGIIGEEVQAAILGQKSPEQAADDMQARLETAMAD